MPAVALRGVPDPETGKLIRAELADAGGPHLLQLARFRHFEFVLHHVFLLSELIQVAAARLLLRISLFAYCVVCR